MRLIKDEFTNLSLSRQRKYQLRMVKKGRCVICGRESVSKGYCLTHQLDRSQRDLRYRQKSKGSKERRKGKWLNLCNLLTP